MAETPARQSRAARAAEQAKKDQPGLKAVPAAGQSPKPEAAAKPSETPKPQPAKPAAQIDLGSKMVEYFFPTATLSGGEVISCPHSRYGHEGAQAAKRCISALVAQRGHRVA
jgi:hypothetical protein